MEFNDKLQPDDLKVLKTLFDNWKETSGGRLTFNAQPCDVNSVSDEAAMPKGQFVSRLQNLQGFDFVSLDEDQVRLLPSGINYCLGLFDGMKH